MQVFTLIKLLPEILGLIKAIEVAIEKAEEDRKVKNDIQTISDAFKTGDASKLNALFAKPA